MLRNKGASSMQKTYDDCYLICSTAVYFESQNNETEALRSWKSALNQINYYHAYKLPSGYSPKSETEWALYDALMVMRNQCNERVDLLEALKQSRKDAGKSEPAGKDGSRVSSSTVPQESRTWLGEDSIPPMQYSDLPSQSLRPPMPPRPSVSSRDSSNSLFDRDTPVSRVHSSPLTAPPTLPVPSQKQSRSPSPDHSRRQMRTTLRPERKGARSSRPTSAQTQKPATMKAAGLAWDTKTRPPQPTPPPNYDPTIEARLSAVAARRSIDQPTTPTDVRSSSIVTMPDPSDYTGKDHITPSIEDQARLNAAFGKVDLGPKKSASIAAIGPSSEKGKPPVPPPHGSAHRLTSLPQQPSSPPVSRTKPPDIKYRKEYPKPTTNVPPSVAKQVLGKAYSKDDPSTETPSGITRKPVGSGDEGKSNVGRRRKDTGSESEQDKSGSHTDKRPRAQKERKGDGSQQVTPPTSDSESMGDTDSPKSEWEVRVENLLNDLPKGVDTFAAKQILNEIVVKGDEVHWEDVAGLDAAKKALKEAVVYPFLRPDLFSGLREPARGMLLFGPPGTGKTMLARAVATESKSCFFAISASSLTSKWHGDSEKLVRALFAMAKALAPSIIFVDEIDSLLNSRGGGSEHEASRRSKTEFLIQWSDLQRAAAGRDSGVGDASRVLVLAATNCPWDIDDAARRRFVRRQYIPLPEAETRETQIRTLLKTQKHELSDRDISRLVRWTDGYSGSDMTSLCKDAAMQPLRHLGEALLTTPIDKIRPIKLADFEASLESIRPSVSKRGLEEFEEWAREFGERAG